MHFLKSPIIYNTPLCPALYKLALNAPSIASIASPGQFVMVKTSTSSDPLLARPFSISKVLPNKTNHSCLEILYRVVGRGTHLLTKFRQGENVQLFGPLGNGFQLDNNSKHLIIVAGGIGIAPMRFLIDRVIALRSSKFFSSEPTVPTITLFFGAKNGLEVPIADSLMNTVNAVYVTTEDGSRGTQGMITDIFKSYAESIEFP
ncbi:MAG: hypothetical protein SVW57_03905, partial [Thermodesulfobacteriota bacterium]|nr:hypothetical protein [Thermodesulfobacteriota bacterium]